MPGACLPQVLQQVYTSPVNVDDELVESIRFPADHPNAPEVFCRVVRSAPHRAMTHY